MRKFLLSILFLNVIALGSLPAQQVLGKEKISYQAVALDLSGKVLANSDLTIRTSFTSKDGTSNVYFSEIHQVTTNDLGLFQLVIGDGSKSVETALKEVPWGKKAVFLSIEMENKDGTYHLLNRSQMLAVPYAFQAAEAGKVQDKAQMDLRNQSIYWTTTGNNESRPDPHFLGNRDAKDLYVKTDNTTRAIFTKEGQMQIYAGSTINGADTDESSYPVTVKNSDQGIYIEIDESRDGDNNFVSFADDTQIWGRVEGQTWDELTATDAYKIQVALFTLKGISLLAGAIAEFVIAAGEASSVLGAAAAAFATANGVAMGVETAALLLESINWGTYLAETVGVSYSSGGADYAEYIPRAFGVRDLYPAEVVGIKNGQVSLNTQNADHLRIISVAPMVLGNMPQPGQEDLYEKVAFRGQVPVNVVGGVEIGDYILPSGNNDGLAVAVCAEDMKIGDYENIIGVAWTRADFAPINTVNVAIGINSNDLGGKVDELDQKVSNILDYLQGTGDLATLDQVSQGEEETLPRVAQQTALQKRFSDEEFDRMLELSEPMLKQFYAKVRGSMINQGIDLEQHPQIEALIENPVPYLKELRRNKDFASQWGIIDQMIQSKLNND
jgi:hypothetical protein